MSTPFKMKGHTLPGPMQKKINPFSKEYKSMTRGQKREKYGEDLGRSKFKGASKSDGTKYKAINRENVAISLGKLDAKIKGALSSVDKAIKGPEGGSYLRVLKGPKGISIKNRPYVNPNTDGDSKKTTTKKTTTSGKPDWSKAPKNNTQARRDWYTKHNLAQDATTKITPIKMYGKKSPAKNYKKGYYGA